MEIKHIVETSEQECTDLYMMAIAVATTAYPSIEAQDRHPEPHPIQDHDRKDDREQSDQTTQKGCG